MAVLLYIEGTNYLPKVEAEVPTEAQFPLTVLYDCHFTVLFLTLISDINLAAK